jgi:hypothetical protein
MGGSARRDGGGGEVEGPEFDIDLDECWKMGNVSGERQSSFECGSPFSWAEGGTGGTKATEIDLRSKEGPAKAPNIRTLGRSSTV